MIAIDPRSYSDSVLFAAEMAALRASAWQLVGLADDFPAGGPPVECLFFARRLSVRQRSEGYRGSWPDGVTAPVPRIAAVGRFVFASEDQDGDPSAYLGPYADYLRAISPLLVEVILSESVEVAANWKLFVELTLDDYHLPTVHPTTFGAGEEIASHRLVYRRDGLHSCYLRRRDAHWSFDGFWRDLPSGVVDRMGYKIFQMFPCALVAGMYEGVIVGTVHPIAADRSVVTNRVLTWHDRLTGEAERAPLVEYLRAVFAEDRAACEEWQTGVGQLARAPTLGRLEERVRWFHEAYAQFMAGSSPGRSAPPR